MNLAFPFLRARREVLLFLLIAGMTWLAATLSLQFVSIAEQVSPVWLPSGVAFWAYLRFGKRALPAVFVGAFFGSISTRAPLAVCLASGIANTVEPVVALYLARRFFDLRPTFERVRDVAGLLFGAAIGGPILGAFIGAAVIKLYGWAPDAHFASIWFTWWSGDGLGLFIAAPALLTARVPRWQKLQSTRLLEVGAFCALLALTGWVVFRGSTRSEGLYTQTFLLFPFIVWAGLRLGPAGATWMSFATAVAAVWATRVGLGPFSVLIPIEGALIVQSFLFMFASTGLLLASATAERERASVKAQFLATAIRDTHDAVVIARSFDARSVSVEYANDAFARLVGVPADPLMRWHFDEPGENPSRREALKGALQSREPFLSRWSLQRADGTFVETELQVSPVVDTDQRHLFVLTFRDVSELKRMEAKLVLAERLSSMGLIAAGVGHEINNPLGFLMNHLLVLETELAAAVPDAGLREGLRSRLRDASFGAERIASIVRSLKVLSRDAAAEHGVVDLSQLLRRMLELAAHRVRERGALVVEFGPTPPVLANEARLGQVFLNLVLNAVQALPEGEPERQEVRIRCGTAPDGGAFFEVCDTGPGVAEPARSRIFEPFYTTKSQGEGTGLGLFIARQIVTEHGGEVAVSANVGRGACFRVSLPAHREDAASLTTSPEQTSGARRAEAPRARVLIVDDEVRLATSLRMLLERTHDVVALNDGREALQRLLTNEPFDVVLCDLQMPQMSGMEVYRRLQSLAPDRAERIIFFSGGAYTREAQQFLSTVQSRVLDKPVPLARLLSSIDETVQRLGRWSPPQP